MTPTHDATDHCSHTAKRRPWGTALVWLSSLAAVTLGIVLYSLPGGAQQTPTSPTLTCPDANPAFVMPPVISASAPDEASINTISLTEDFQRLPTSLSGTVTCAPQLLRLFRADGTPPPPAATPANPNYRDPIPGPTLRARVGDLVRLKFVNQVNSNRFDRNMDIDACTQVGQGGSVYPTGFNDVPPNCLHASTTTNIHYHGTHTSPTSTGDNVFLQIRPLPRDNQGNLTVKPADAEVGFDTFFKTCADQLKNPLNQWPATWAQLPEPYTKKQMQMLQAYEASNPSQPLWTRDNDAIQAGTWPIYYIGAYPYCFALPRYTATTFPPPAGSTSPTMGQAPGTHWYHAHKHGSTSVNVMNGMTGAFIIEGEYDDAINAVYSTYKLTGDKAWNTRNQPVMVLNQLSPAPNILFGGGPNPIDFVVNGRIRPVLTMQPGEVQLWRIVNTSARSAAYFMAPPRGLSWRQLAQDGVQFADVNYRTSGNRPFYLAPGNRVDLLVQATRPMSGTILIQNVMARAEVKPTPAKPTQQDPNPGTVLLTVNVTGNPVTRDGQPAQMPFLSQAPAQPVFLTNITDQEWAKSSYAHKTLDFDSKGPGSPQQHTINGQQFENGHAHVGVRLSNVEEWKIENFTNGTTGPGLIDHPFHIHVNPFQITEVFDPNENLIDPKTGQLLGVVVNGVTTPVPRYVISPAVPTYPAQCVLDPNNSATWKPCGPTGPSRPLVWWDVFAIPSARAVVTSSTTSVVIPGYFKMRSRFVDYAGDYVLHCHILPHEDRGMMFTVQVLKGTVPPHH